MLLLIDLDNTLIDRAASFRRWAAEFVVTHGGGPMDVEWTIEADRDGYEPRERLAARLRDRLSLRATAEEVAVELRAGVVAHVTLDPAVGGALAEAVGAGWVPIVVTNGSVRQQESKLRHTGLDRMVLGWVISEGAGVRKPDPRIFELGARAAGWSRAAGGWMIGDHAEYDVGGGTAAGLSTVWLRRGRTWPDGLPYRPTRIADDCAAAIRGLVAGRPSDVE